MAETDKSLSGDLHTSAELKEMQAWPLEWKIQVAQQKIAEWYDYYNGNVYVSFSGGKDSTVLLDLVRKIYPNVKAVFMDTGLEFPEIRDFVKTIENVEWVKPSMTFRAVIERYGYPLISKEVAAKIYDYRNKPDGYAAQRFDPESDFNKRYNKKYSLAKYKWIADSDIPISHRCCEVLKKHPAQRFDRESGLKPMLGTMACESGLRNSEWMKHGCNAFDAKHPTSKPLSIWTEQDVLRYLYQYKIPFSKIYGDIIEKDGKLCTTGRDRTGCVFCAFGAHLEKEPNRFQRLKITHPQLWQYCMKPWEDGGLGMGGSPERNKCKN